MRAPIVFQLLRWCWIFLTGVALALPLGAAANSAWFFRTWQPEDGLPAHRIVSLAQTPDGYLWIATHLTLSRFDGVRFEDFTPAVSEGPQADLIRAMISDRRGRLWITRDSGMVTCVERGLAAPFVTPAVQPLAMAEDVEGSIWISDAKGKVCRIKDGIVRSMGNSEGLPGPGVCWLATDPQGQIWYSQGGSVGRYQNGRFISSFTWQQQSARLLPARQGGLWLCTGLKIFHFQEGAEPKEVTDLRLGSGQAEAVVTALHEDKAGGLWIGTDSGGLFRYDAHGVQKVETSHPNILNILEDSEANIWVGTFGGGLNRLSSRVIHMEDLSTGLPFAAVKSACEDASGTLWVLGQNGMLACQTNGLWRPLPASDWPEGEANSMTLVAGDVVIGTRSHGVFCHVPGAFVRIPGNQQLEHHAIRLLYPCSNGDLWIATDSRVARFRGRDGSLKYFALPTESSNVRVMAESSDGDIWMATTFDKLLLRIHNDELINETSSHLGGTQAIRSLHNTSDGSLWIGHAGQGLDWSKDGRQFRFRAKHGLWDEYISQIFSDDFGRLWMAGDRGVFYVALSELEAVAVGKAQRVRSVVLGRGEGMPNLVAAIGGSSISSRTRDGRLLMPMLAGLAIVDTRVRRNNLPPPPVIIERLTVNGEIAAAYDLPVNETSVNSPVTVNLRNLSAPLHLRPGVNRMDVEFTALSLSSPENSTFRYQLKGIDEDWVEAGTMRVARYPHIPPGSYQFRVIACNQAGIWNETGAQLAFTVQPQFWETGWFRVAAVASASGLLAGSVLLVTRWRYRRRLERLEQQRALERERARIAQDLHDDLGAGLVEISFGSELGQDRALAGEEIRAHMREMGVRARELVEALDEIVWAVNPKHDDIASLAAYFCEYAQDYLKAMPSLRCHLDVDRELPVFSLDAEHRHNLFLALKEALSNVVQHSHATELRIGISVGDETLSISIADNGQGCDLNTLSNRPGSDGLNNMQQRLEKLGGICAITSLPNLGMKVVFRLHLHAKGASSSI